ncbi:hypothetical protein [Streptomyces hainanensis]|uniref:Uncharacterized protein n=1 Tax=Streptomyces hainanensis TaxID=402648 RepID=A0A4V2Y3R4_9ACTN|nr:hypothetical protein [Streptomyces hainanensis]TDC77545.1 hypothetical protein E1283_06970 [Streptomyces hainanensis]
MSDEGEPDAAELAQLCRELRVLRAMAERAGLGDGFAALLAAARRGEPLREHLAALGPVGATHRGEPPAELPPDTGPVELFGTGPGHVAVGAYRCPVGRCARRERPGPEDDLPQCALHGRPLRFE